MLHPESEQAQPGAQGEGGLDLPWLQTVQDRASKPRTERLTDAQPVQPPQPPQPAEQPQQVTSAQAETGTTPSQPAAKEPEPASEQLYPPQSVPDPNEAPPEWVVSILEPTATPPTGQEQTYEPEELEHIMPWVHGQQGTSQGRDQPTQADASGLPPWLSDITVQETLQSSTMSGQEQRPPIAPELELEGIEPFVPPALTDEDEASAPTAGAAPQEQVPAWLRSITGKGEPESVVEPERVTSLPMLPADLTSTVSAPLVRDTPVRPPRAGSVEVLAGLIGATEAVSPKPRRVAQDDLRAQGVAEASTAKRGAGAWLLPDGIIYLAILGILLAVLIVRPQLGDMPAPSASGVQPFYDSIEAVSKRALPQERIVLIAYDWDATRSAEMSLLAESVMRHLMARHIGFITVSTNPQGPGFAQQVTSRIHDEYGYVYGREYLVMGYLPGSQAALGALASNFRRNLPIDYEQNRRLSDYPGFTGGSRLVGIESFALVIALTSDESEMRNWVEQVGARTGVPIVAAVPQGMEPLARPYRDIPGAGLQAIISGSTGALQYTKQLQAQGLPTGKEGATTLTDRLNAQSAAQLLVAVVIIAALIGMATRKVVRR
ncbi:MAG TPA: hypothetical protein VJ183_11440 [Chloroflexia bacterium]|nr:hypothetical protein [Chloroflexia bacterium]